jgi:hypothetical protein
LQQIQRKYLIGEKALLEDLYSTKAAEIKVELTIIARGMRILCQVIKKFGSCQQPRPLDNVPLTTPLTTLEERVYEKWYKDFIDNSSISGFAGDQRRRQL